MLHIISKLDIKYIILKFIEIVFHFIKLFKKKKKGQVILITFRYTWFEIQTMWN